MQFIIVTGLSGSGKSCAMNILEDIGFYCIDNMPPQLIPKFADICTHSEEGKLERVAIAVDIRSGDIFSELPDVCDKMKKTGIDIKILYLESSDDVVIKRYKETRRIHPLNAEFNGCLPKAVNFERQQLTPMREITDYYIDTSFLSTSQLKQQITNIFLDNVNDSMIVKIMSFGFKYGASSEADLVFDVRCLPNPYYIPELKQHTGCEECVRDYVLKSEVSQQLLEKLRDLIDFLLPLYVKEGKSQLVIAFGCTGGKHRSVTFAEYFSDYIGQKGIKIHKTHRDIMKDR